MEVITSVGFRYKYSLDAFKSFHVNKYVDHHANEIAFQIGNMTRLSLPGEE
jgi:hypothetical protein